MVPSGESHYIHSRGCSHVFFFSSVWYIGFILGVFVEIWWCSFKLNATLWWFKSRKLLLFIPMPFPCTRGLLHKHASCIRSVKLQTLPFFILSFDVCDLEYHHRLVSSPSCSSDLVLVRWQRVGASGKTQADSESLRDSCKAICSIMALFFKTSLVTLFFRFSLSLAYCYCLCVLILQFCGPW